MTWLFDEILEIYMSVAAIKIIKYRFDRDHEQ